MHPALDYLKALGSASLTGIWGLLVAGALIGWGRCFVRFLRLPSCGRASEGAMGMAGAMLIGGWLCAARAATAPALFAFVAAGLLLFVAREMSAANNANPPDVRRSGWLQLVIVALIALRFFGESAPPWYLFNGHDDFHAYLAHPVEIVQTGTFGPAPFSERRLSSLGGQAFLQALVAVARPPESTRLVDSGIALLFAAGLVAERCRRVELNARFTFSVLLFLLLYVPPDVNTTSLFTGITLVLLLFDLLSIQTGPAVENTVAVAMVAAALCSAKSTLVPPIALILILFYACQIALQPRRFVWFLAAAGVAAMVLVFLAPWMWLMWKSSGTPLYPWLGKGFHSSAYQPLNPVFQSSVRRFFDALLNPLYAPLLLLLLPGSLRAWSARVSMLKPPEKSPHSAEGRRNRAAAFAFCTGAIASWLLMCISIPADAYRYSFPFIFPVCIWSAVLGAKFVQDTSVLFVRRSAAVILAFCTVLPLIFMGRAIPQRYYLYLKARTFGYKEAIIASEDARREVRALQNSIPPGAPLLARLDRNFLFDFRRNPILIIDIPGGASPPPGMPLESDAEALASYFREKGIRYLAYSYGNEANFARATHSDRLNPGFHPWLRAQARQTFAFQDRLATLGDTRRRIFDDGRAFVLDLNQPHSLAR